MKFYIKETKSYAKLSIIDPKTDQDFIKDFIGNHGALIDGQFDYDEELDAYVCSEDTFNWWYWVVEENQALRHRINEIIDDLKVDSEKVHSVVYDASLCDLEDLASNTNKALDDLLYKVRLDSIKNASCLSELLEAIDEAYNAILNEAYDTIQYTHELDRLMADLPTFGGEEPKDTASVWSWDEDDLLVGEGDFEIVSRAEWFKNE